ncbi:hypothetical protein A3F45_00920 [Candidatus Curtissbacteria bacterium RIFCSPHIGHO2_12_FULL_41_17]|uniref:Type II secretion system protein GspG C-terminal domain-containing protein n=1 Tax=Candidatus Curtissbacteria bacterium RIFCSPHIGHO2_12_FULL_41_17 TaxID=1797722 RepID=A0A1F5HNZ7_9BACT|nr:MAG: hypothetical protein A3F45_00920 [Candidatus Curtissbacteria bacterium RIFCSPHIGHO2_12_FULL_41_17]
MVHCSQLTVNSFKKTVNRKPLTLNHKGFTLIELLVVITILGVLAGLTLASYGGTQERSRDSRRKTDLDAIKKTLELAKQDTPGAYYYAGCNDFCGVSTAVVPITGNPTLSSAGYIKQVPKDPKTNTDYRYIPRTASNGLCTTACTTYSLVACLENARDTQKDIISNTNVCPAASKTVSYTITPN